MPEDRESIDAVIMNHAKTLKWPLLRSLEHPGHYRAFLGLPKAMEQTRKYVTEVSESKLNEILLTNLVTNISTTTDPEELPWIEIVLRYMTGDGRRKKDLGGYILREKGTVRAAINKATKRRQELAAMGETKQHSSSANNLLPSIQPDMERDVRLLDRERQESRTQGIHSMIDDAMRKT